MTGHAILHLLAAAFFWASEAHRIERCAQGEPAACIEAVEPLLAEDGANGP